ncbi:MAG: ATP-dependent DNA helicase RecG [Calditrichaeota bacterium]|nr:ATP-dependent DNA helicase RecG [Calditrichota bacterium]
MSEKEKTYELQFVKGIGPKRAEVLHRHGIRTYLDLLNYFPRKYVDRSNIVPLDKLQPDQEITVIGKVEAAGIRHGRRRLFYIVISDGKGILEAVWFNGIDYFKRIFKVGEWVSLSGKVAFYRGFQITHPEYDRLGEGELNNLMHTGKILAFYPENEAFKRVGLNSYTFRKIFFLLLNKKTPEVEEYFPPELKQKRGFINRAEAYRQIHIPENQKILEKAIYRFKYEEFFNLQLMLALQRAHQKAQPIGFAFEKKSERLAKLYHNLPFEMTEAQKRVVKEIRNDMKSPSPMNRLLQGDVGAGKTLVALMAMLIAIDNGKQAALMVPTEILAEQHFFNIRKLVEPLNVKVHLITGSISQKERKSIAQDLSGGEPQIIIGTHALIYDSVNLPDLGLVVIDEQHRFGVMQRARLIEKGLRADVLVMTATPIPRTLALTAYGSLDVSVIDELPPNRKPVTTIWRFDNSASKIYDFIKQRTEAGEQAYIIYPLVEESEKLDLKAATEAYERLSVTVFKNNRVGLLHGRMKPAEKDRVMSEFVEGKIQILISTTVIEVGIDVPNATIMLIEHAERFGLSQLHQLRGRVGRGRQKSYCILKTPYNIGEIAQQRMKIMTETHDGFVIAEKDLELRGWGDFFGTKQSGMPDFKIANPITDRPILEEAREDAFALVRSDPFLRKPEHKDLLRYLKLHLKDRMELANIS